MTENKKYNYNGSFGRVQFLANLEFIKNELEKGRTFKSIYNELVNQKKVTCSYKSLSRYKTIFLGFSNNCKGKHEINEKQKTQAKQKKVTTEQPQKNKQQTEQAKKHHTELKEKNDTFMMENYDPVGNSQQNEKKENN